VAARGAGIRLRTDAEIRCIRSAITRVLQDERFRQGALALGKAMSKEGNPAQGAADEIERAARPDG
jgi:UDP:flavonoid glycosyltransferase YjiC (YdhE family)